MIGVVIFNLLERLRSKKLRCEILSSQVDARAIIEEAEERIRWVKARDSITGSFFELYDAILDDSRRETYHSSFRFLFRLKPPADMIDAVVSLFLVPGQTRKEFTPAAFGSVVYWASLQHDYPEHIGVWSLLLTNAHNKTGIDVDQDPISAVMLWRGCWGDSSKELGLVDGGKLVRRFSDFKIYGGYPQFFVFRKLFASEPRRVAWKTTPFRDWFSHILEFDTVHHTLTAKYVEGWHEIFTMLFPTEADVIEFLMFDDTRLPTSIFSLLLEHVPVFPVVLLTSERLIEYHGLCFEYHSIGLKTKILNVLKLAFVGRTSSSIVSFLRERESTSGKFWTSGLTPQELLEVGAVGALLSCPAIRGEQKKAPLMQLRFCELARSCKKGLLSRLLPALSQIEIAEPPSPIRYCTGN